MMGRSPRTPRYPLVAAVLAAGALLTAPPALADRKPYPDISGYTRVNIDDYRIAGKPGWWFSTPMGLNCGIWEDGSFGCDGPIPGAPAGTNQIGLFHPEQVPHFDNTDQLRFVAGSPQKLLPPGSYLSAFRGGLRCAVTPDGGVYCTAGDVYASGLQFLVTPSGSWMGDNY